MHRLALTKPDGRQLWLYAREPLSVASGPVPVPDTGRAIPEPHVRWHPLEAEWVIYAAHRQGRPLSASGGSGFDPLAPTRDPRHPTEVPEGNWEVAVFENRFPSLTRHASAISAMPHVATAAAVGRAEVIVFGQDETTSLGTLGDDRIALVLDVLAERTRLLAAQDIRYVLPFENRGPEMGVTLPHPHGQIYGYGFIPARQARQTIILRDHLHRAGRDLAGDIAEAELEAGLRVIDRRGRAVSFVPAFARFPYEIWVLPLVPASDLTELSASVLDDVAAVLGAALRRLDALWSRPMPYLLTVNQRPCDGEKHPEWRVRVEIWPIRRSADKLKYLAGTELAAGVFASDVLPEEAAAALRRALP